MDAKKVRNAGMVSVLSLALALGAGIASSVSVGAQSQPYVGNAKPDPSHPIVSSISGNSVVLNITPDATREVLIDASTLVLKDGKFAGVSALQVGDRVQVNPRISLPNGLEGSSGGSAAQAAPSQADPANPDKSQLGGSNGSGSGQPDAKTGATSPNAPVAPLDPNNKNNNAPPPPSSGGGQTADDGSVVGAPAATNVIWVTSNNDQLLGGVVHWAQDGTAILNIPGVGYSEYVIHTSNSTGYQKMASAGTAPEAATAADMKVGTSVVVLGSDGAPDNAGYFTAKAILVLPASGKLR
ncbi:MAG: hypothetical protein ABJA50_08750 [Chloroflexota bacterium]